MIKIQHLIAASLVSSLLSGCVTQSYENNADSPVIENNSTNNEIAVTRISLAMGYLKMGNTTQAKINLEKAKRFAPNLTQVYTAYAHYYDAVEEPEQAIVAYEKALSLDPEDADTLNNYGVFLCKKERYAESEQQMLKAIAVPSYTLVSKSYENLALCQLEARLFEKSEMYLAKSISHSPGSSSALLQMLRLQYAMGKYDEAQVYLRRYEKSTRRFTPNALALAYKTFEKVNNKRVAKNYAGMLVKMFPNSYEAKQYILNELKHIEADDLATEYRLAGGKNQNKPKKRVMVLSPNKKTGISLKKAPKSAPTSEVTALTEKVKQESITIQETTLVDNNPTTSTRAVDNAIESTIDKVSPLVNSDSVDEIDSSSQDKVAEIADTLNDKVETTTAAVTKNVEEQKTETLVKAKTTVNDQGHKMLTLPIHVVAKGDSLFSISKRYNIKMYKIERWNGFKRTQVLKIGNVIYLADPKKALKAQ